MKKQWILLAATIIGSPLLAQENAPQSDSTKTKLLDDVVVTANKTPQKQSSTGKVLTVINRRTLENNSGRSLSQVLNEQAGLTINGSQNAPGTNQTVYLRGALASNTLILIDGMPVTDGSGITMEFDLNHLTADQVERVEILKGAQSVLYGSDAVAGVINIITRKNRLGKKFSVNAGFGAGTYGTLEGNIRLSGAAGKFNYSLQYNRSQSDGFSSAHDATGKNNFDKDGAKQDIYNVGLGYSITSKWAVNGYWQNSRYKAAIDDAPLADDRNSTLSNKQQLFGIQSVHELKNGRLTIKANFLEVNRAYDDPVNNPVGPGDFDPFNANYKGNSYFAESYLNLPINKHLDLLAGIDFRKNTADISSTYGKLGKDSLNANIASAYASFTIKDMKGFGADLGGRFTHHQDFGTDFTYTINPYFLLWKKLKAYTSFATAFKAPSIYQLASEYGNTALDPERSSQFEAGLQYTGEKKNSGGRITYFRRNIRDIIVFQRQFTPPYGRYNNADKQSDEGLETEWTISPVEKWTLTANYTFLEGRITTNASGKDSSFHNLYRRPKHNANLSTGVQVTAKLYAGAGFRWVGKRQDLYFNPSSFATETKKLASYYTLDVYAHYTLSGFLTFWIDFRNITDQQYFDLYGYNSRRFNMMAGLKLSL